MATMTKTPTQRKAKKAPEAVHGTTRWIGGNPTQWRLDDGDAILQITATGKETSFFHVETIRDGDKTTGYRLVKIDGLEHTATYDVEITPHGLRCDCPDATYTDRPGGCKHSCGLKAALTAANLS